MLRIITFSTLATFIFLISPLQNYWYWTQLPARVATHFNATGQPDGWMERTPAVLMMLGMQMGLPIFVLVSVAWMNKLPKSMINLPNREYWLSEDRREETHRYLFDQFLALAIALCVFFAVVNHLSFLANIQGKGLNNFWFMLGFISFMLYITFFIVRTLIHFRLPDVESPDQVSIKQRN